MYGKLNVTTSRPRSDSASAKSTMDVLRWSAPAPCARIRVPTVSDTVAELPRCLTPSYTSALVAPVSNAIVSSLGLFKDDTHLGVGFQRVGHRQRPELRRERPREHAVDVALHHAGQRHATVLDDDVDRRVRHDAVVPEV